MREDLLGRRVLHADVTPVAMRKPANRRDGKAHRAHLWSYCNTAWDDINAVVFDFAESRAGHKGRRFLGIDEDGSGGWRGTLICDDYAGYKQVMNAGVTEAGCLAHARRKFHELWVNRRSTLAEGALKLFGALYNIEREAKSLQSDERLRLRQTQSRPAADLLHDWLFAGSLHAGQRAAAIMSLLHTAKLDGHEPYAYLKDVLLRLLRVLYGDGRGTSEQRTTLGIGVRLRTVIMSLIHLVRLISTI